MAKRAKKTADEQRAEGRTPFLTVGDVQNGDVLQLTGFNRELAGRFGVQIVCEVRHDASGKLFDWAFKKGGDVHRKMFRAFGRNMDTWQGSVNVKVGKRERYEWVDFDAADSDNPPFDVPGENG